MLLLSTMVPKDGIQHFDNARGVMRHDVCNKARNGENPSERAHSNARAVRAAITPMPT